MLKKENTMTANYNQDDKYGIQVSEMSARWKWDIVVAFDIGTSYSGYAYSDKKEILHGEIHLNEWVGNMVFDTKAKAPTTILFTKDKEFHSFGYEAEQCYAEQVEEKTHSGWYRFRNFKMDLYDRKKFRRNLEIMDDSGAKSLPAMDLFSSAIRYLKSHFEEAIKNKSLVFDKSNILYVITVPAIWTESAKQFMKEAAKTAGIPDAQILIALEPEAAALHCRNLKERTLMETFQPGRRYMVLDLGGGTVDTVVHHVMENGSLAEVYKASGGDWGGNLIDKEFQKYIQRTFSSDTCLKTLWENAPLDALELEKDFEQKKRQTTNKETAKITLKLPDRLKAYSNASVSSTGNVSQFHMRVQNSEFQEFFKEPIAKISTLIEQILKEVGEIDQILFVGGFSCSQFLIERIKEHSSFSNIKFCCPSDAGLAVLKGAVLFGYNPRAVSSRICRYTYGIGVMKPFDKDIHPTEKYAIVDDEKMCTDILDVLIYEGEVIKFDEHRSLSPDSSHKRKERKEVTLQKGIYAAKNVKMGDLKFTTDDDVVCIGKIVNYPPAGGWPDLVNFRTDVFFGQTDIKVEDYDITNDRTYNAEFQLLG